MSEWRPFQELFAIPIRNGVYVPKDSRGSGYYMLNMGELFAFARIPDLEMERVPLSERDADMSVLEPGDLLFARRSLVLSGAGKCSIFVGQPNQTTFESSIIRVRLDNNLASPEFYFYFFNSPQGHYALETIAEQVAVAGIRSSDLANLQVPYFPLEEQRAIAHILGSLDDKIEANRRMNETLEATARAIFKSWFVDFDPVHDKSRGEQPPGMDAATAALFPDAFEDSELGLIPAGWEVGNVGDIADNMRRGVNPEDLPPDTFYIGLEHMPRQSIGLADWGTVESINSNKFRFGRGEILFGKLRPYFHKVGFAPIDGVCSTDILVISPTEEIFYGMALMYLSSEDVVEYATRVSTGTKMPRANWENLAQYPVIIPTQELLTIFNTASVPMFEEIAANIHESRTLTETRDALLPKLVSGEIRVGDALE